MRAELVQCRCLDVQGCALVVTRIPERLTVKGRAVALEVLFLALVDWERGRSVSVVVSNAQDKGKKLTSGDTVVQQNVGHGVLGQAQVGVDAGKTGHVVVLNE